jgi:hypothetical protein
MFTNPDDNFVGEGCPSRLWQGECAAESTIAGQGMLPLSEYLPSLAFFMSEQV